MTSKMQSTAIMLQFFWKCIKNIREGLDYLVKIAVFCLSSKISMTYYFELGYSLGNYQAVE